MNKILLIEDSESTRNAVENYLNLNDYEVSSCSCLKEAQQALNRESPDLAIIDVNLPDGNGFFFAKEYMAQKETPFVFLTSNGEESDIITGLEQGAADYIVKPFSLKEMILRVEGILGRCIQKRDQLRSVWALGRDRIEIYKENHRILLNGTPVSLTPMEWEILLLLISCEGGILSRDHIRSALPDAERLKSLKTVDSHIRNIRQKLLNPDWIYSIRGFGFRFTGESVRA